MATTLAAYVRHAEKHGTEDIFETAAADLDALDLGRFSLRLQNLNPKWKLPNVARDRLALALIEKGADTRDVCRMAMVSRSTLWRLKQEAQPPDRPSEGAFQSGESVSNRDPEGNGVGSSFNLAGGGS
jgi:hypothetical protein